jgi:hypothetical protein
MTIRLKVVKRKEEQARKVKDLMDMFKVPNTSSNTYYHHERIIGGSSLSVTDNAPAIDPKIAKTKDLFLMFGLIR